MLLESLVNPEIDLAPTLAAYRSALRAAAESGRSPDDPAAAETLAGLARSLALTAAQIRVDHAQFTKLLRLERRFDAGELARLEAELEKRLRADMIFSTSGFEVQRRGYVQDDDGEPFKCERDQRFDVLQAEYDATTGDERSAVLDQMQTVKDEADRLARARRQTEEDLIAMLNSKDRLAGFRRGNRRLFPEADD